MAYSRYQEGEVLILHKGKKVNTTVGSAAQSDRLVRMSNSLIPHQTVKVPVGYEHRPDLISNVFYGTPLFWHLILEYNGITDPYNQLNVGDIIKIPNVL